MIRACAATFAMTAATVLAAFPGSANAQKWFDKAVKKVEARFTPTEAKPGQTVTFTVTVELNKGYHTYPAAQPDPKAESMVNVVKFPAPGSLIFVGQTQDPKGYEKKAEPDLGIKELRYYFGTITYTRKAVVSPKARHGAAVVKLPEFSLSICDELNCFPPKKVPVEATLKILEAPAVPVEKAYADEVARALAGK